MRRSKILIRANGFRVSDCQEFPFFPGLNMFFTQTARIFAIVIFALALLQVGVGLLFASEYLGPAEPFLKRYTIEKTTGAMIDKGLHRLLLAVALGTLAEISRAEISLALGRRS
jgi:hypothetical protein